MSWAIRSVVLIAAAMFVPTTWGQQKAPDVTLTLLSSVSEAAPGEAFELALKFEFPTGFHIYWENPGDSGMAPQVNWKLPEGFVAGPLRFPAPKRHEASGLITYVLEGSPILLTTVTPGKDATVGENAKIEADVSWLVCKESCFRGSKSVNISIPIANASRPVEDDITFKLAHRSMPVAAAKATHVTIRPSASKSTIAKGDAFEIVIVVDIKDGFHTQSNAPLGEFFVPTMVFPRTVTGLQYGEPVWPEPHIRTDKVFGKISEFVDAFKVRVPVKVLAPTESADVQISGLLNYQACDETGRCHPPQAVEWSVGVKSESVLAGASSDSGKDNLAGASPDSQSNTETDPKVAQSESAKDAPTEKIAIDDKEPTDVVATTGIVAATKVAKSVDNGWMSRWGIWGAILGGMLGGLILNVMPCVLPVISIKILSFVQQADEDPKRVFHLGLMFCAGIIVSFWALAGGILALRAYADPSAGWGAFFQQPRFIIGMCALMFAFALSLFGVFEISLPGTTTTKLAGATESEGLTGAFMKGVLATLLATPCTAPFLGPALFFALTSSMAVVAIVFTAVGVGMASPYFLLTARPGWLNYLPRPGAWMNTFKQLMGFLLMGTVVWLIWIYAGLTGADEVVFLVSFLCALGVACWIYGRVNPMWNVVRKGVVVTLAFAVAGAGTWFAFFYEPPQLDWKPYARGRAEQLAEDGYTVYVDYTARWCLTCQTNKKVVLHSDPVRRRFHSANIVAIKADNTNYDPNIAEDMLQFGRDGVPLNVIYPAGRPNEPIVLPTILTRSIVIDALDQAGRSQTDMPVPDDVIAAVN
jgi:thiol:disulfide interchange protein